MEIKHTLQKCKLTLWKYTLTLRKLSKFAEIKNVEQNWNNVPSAASSIYNDLEIEGLTRHRNESVMDILR